MKKAGTTQVIHNSGDPPLVTGPDWAEIDAMSEAEIRAGAIADADAQPLAEADVERMTKLVNVKKLRERFSGQQSSVGKQWDEVFTREPRVSEDFMCDRQQLAADDREPS